MRVLIIVLILSNIAVADDKKCKKVFDDKEKVVSVDSALDEALRGLEEYIAEKQGFIIW